MQQSSARPGRANKWLAPNRLSVEITHQPRHRAAARAYLYRHHHLPLLIRTLPETVAGAPGQREHERQDSQNTHDLIS